MLKKYGKKIQKKNSEKTDSSDSRRDDWLLNGTGWGFEENTIRKKFRKVMWEAWKKKCRFWDSYSDK